MAFLRVHYQNNVEKDITLDKRTTSIGRSSENDIVMDHPGVSSRHARINYEGQYYITDLRSTNGTYLNGKKILHHKLSDGDTVAISGFPIIFYA